MENANIWVQRILEINPELQAKIITSLAIILFLSVFRAVAVRLILRRTEDVRFRYRWQKIVTHIAVIFGALLVGRVWFQGVQSLATFLGLLSAGLAIALKDPVGNLAGWLFILWRKPFIVGDRIQVGNDSGDVIDVGLFQFTLLEIGNWVDAEQSTGRMILVPNAMVFAQTIANYSKGFEYIWNEIPVEVTFESDWKKAKKILLSIAQDHHAQRELHIEQQIREASKEYMIFYSALTPIVYTSVKDSGVMLTIRYICEPRRRRDSTQYVWERILEEFSLHDDIDLAYPTRRIVNLSVNGNETTPLTTAPVDGQKKQTSPQPDTVNPPTST